MFKQSMVQQLLYGSICLIAFLIPFPYIFGSIAVITTTLLWLLSGNFTFTFSTLKKRRFLWPIIIFFLLHAVSYFYSTDKQDSLFDLKLKAILLVVPIVVSAGIDLDRRWLGRVIFSFTCGITVVALFTISRGMLIWANTRETQQLFYHSLVKGLSANAVYMSWYVVFSLLCLLTFPWSDAKGKKMSIFLAVSTIIQFIFLILLSSRTLIVIFVITFCLHLLMKRSRFKRTDAFIGIVIFLTILGIIFTNNPIKERYTQIMVSKNVAPKSAGEQAYQFNNLTLRLFIWNAGLENIKQHNLWLYGSGNGDVHMLQNQKLYENGIKTIYDPTYRSDLYNVNLHNMYLQTLFMLGIPGLICFLILVFSPLLKSFAGKETRIFILFNIISLIFMLQEAVLQTQAGVLYYSFFIAIFWNVYYNKSKFSAS